MKVAQSPVTMDQTHHSHTTTHDRAPLGSRFRAYWTLYTLTLRQHLHGKRWLAVGALFLLPASLAVLIRGTTADVPSIALEFLLVFMFIPQAILPLVALLYASGIIQDELEDQTITYLLIRPIAKWAIYVVKLLATLTTTISLTAVFTVLAYVAIYLGAEVQSENVPLRCSKAVSIHALAIVAYCSLFGLMSLLTNRTLVVGILYTAIVEGLLANLPFGIRLASIIYYARLIAFRMLQFDVPMPQGESENIAAEAWQIDLSGGPGLDAPPQVSTCLIVLLVGSLICTILAAWICTSREFHVKTPEKD
jgi:ABC-2 type transport system permease protein